MRIPLRRLPCGYYTLRVTQSLPDGDLYSKLPHAFSSSSICSAVSFTFSSIPISSLRYICFSPSHPAHVPSGPEMFLPLTEALPADVSLSDGFESFPDPFLPLLNTDSYEAPCGASLHAPRFAPWHTFSGFLLHTVSSVHTSGWSVPFLLSLQFRTILFYSLAAHTFLSLRHASFAGNGWQFMFGIQESKDKKDSYHDICHNKSLAFSFDTDVSQHRLTVSNPHGMFLFQIPRRFATPFYLLR